MLNRITKVQVGDAGKSEPVAMQPGI